MCDVTAVDNVVHFLLSQILVHLFKAHTIVFVILEVFNVCVSNMCEFQLNDSVLYYLSEKLRDEEHTHVIAHVEQHPLIQSFKTKLGDLMEHMHLFLLCL